MAAVLAVLALGITGTAAYAQPAPAAAPAAPGAVESYTLPNGLTVMLVEDHATPRVHLDLVFRTGHADDPPGRRMMVRLLGELFADAATRHLGRANRESMLREAGAGLARLGVETRIDDTRFSLVDLPSGQLELALWMLGDRLGFWTDAIDEAAIVSARAAVDKEHAAHTGTPYGAITSIVRQAIYGAKHSCGAALDGDTAELAAVTPAEVRAQGRAVYTPSNAALVVVGDFAPEAVKRMIARSFGTIPAGPARTYRTALPRITLAGEQRLRVAAAVPNAGLVVAWPSAAIYQRDDFVLDVVATLVASRLRLRLVDEEKVALRVWSSEQSFVQGSVFSVTVILAPGRSADEALRAIDAELDRIRAADPAPDDARYAVRERLAEFALTADVGRDRARRTAGTWSLTGDPGSVARYFSEYRGVTAASLRAAVIGNLPPGRRVVAVVTPDPSAPKAGVLVGGP